MLAIRWDDRCATFRASDRRGLLAAPPPLAGVRSMLFYFLSIFGVCDPPRPGGHPPRRPRSGTDRNASQGLKVLPDLGAVVEDVSGRTVGGGARRPVHLGVVVHVGVRGSDVPAEPPDVRRERGPESDGGDGGVDTGSRGSQNSPPVRRGRRGNKEKKRGIPHRHKNTAIPITRLHAPWGADEDPGQGTYRHLGQPLELPVDVAVPQEFDVDRVRTVRAALAALVKVVGPGRRTKAEDPHTHTRARTHTHTHTHAHAHTPPRARTRTHSPSHPRSPLEYVPECRLACLWLSASSTCPLRLLPFCLNTPGET